MIYQIDYDIYNCQDVSPYSFQLDRDKKDLYVERLRNLLLGSYRDCFQLKATTPRASDSGDSWNQLMKDYPNIFELYFPPRIPSDFMSLSAFSAMLIGERIIQRADICEKLKREGYLYEYPYELSISNLALWISDLKTVKKYPILSNVKSGPVMISMNGDNYAVCCPELLYDLKVNVFVCNNWLQGMIDYEKSEGSWIDNGVFDKPYFSCGRYPVFVKEPPDHTWFFRIPENGTKYYCSCKFKDLYESESFTGLIFKPMAFSESNVSPAPHSRPNF